MRKIGTIAIVLLACSYSKSHGIYHENDEGRPRTADTADGTIRRIFRIVSNGTSNEKDDEQLVKLIKAEIVRTAQSIKMPSGSIEAAAARAQKLVIELTAAYTTAIYKSKSTEEARYNFSRFQNTVQRIVDFIKKGQFVL